MRTDPKKILTRYVRATYALRTRSRTTSQRTPVRGSYAVPYAIPRNPYEIRQKSVRHPFTKSVRHPPFFFPPGFFLSKNFFVCFSLFFQNSASFFFKNFFLDPKKFFGTKFVRHPAEIRTTSRRNPKNPYDIPAYIPAYIPRTPVRNLSVHPKNPRVHPNRGDYDPRSTSKK